MKASHLLRGEDAESRARRHLESHGLVFIEANYRCPPGEIDLIMNEEATIVFVEVRYRQDERYGGALESVTPCKQRKLRAAALHYLQSRYDSIDIACRVDVVLVSGNIDGTDGDADVEWIPNAV